MSVWALLSCSRAALSSAASCPLLAWMLAAGSGGGGRGGSLNEPLAMQQLGAWWQGSHDRCVGGSSTESGSSMRRWGSKGIDARQGAS